MKVEMFSQVITALQDNSEHCNPQGVVREIICFKKGKDKIINMIK